MTYAGHFFFPLGQRSLGINGRILCPVDRVLFNYILVMYIFKHKFVFTNLCKWFSFHCLFLVVKSKMVWFGFMVYQPLEVINAKSIFIHKTVLFQIIQLSISTQFSSI